MLVTLTLVISLICMPSGFTHTYQATPLCPCYNYSLYLAFVKQNILNFILLETGDYPIFAYQPPWLTAHQTTVTDL